MKYYGNYNTGSSLKGNDNKLAIKKYNLEKYNVTKTGTIEVKKEEESFFQPVKDFFSFGDKKEEKIISNESKIKNKLAINTTNDKIIVTDSDKKELKIEEVKTEIKNVENTVKKVESIVKEDKVEKKLTAKEKIVEKIKKRNQNRVHTVGVKSIFLNNAYFTKRIATAYKGDNLEQLTNTNKYGCFKTEVLKAKNQRIEGLKAWTCIYYMQGFLGTRKNYEVASRIYNRNIMKKIRTNNTISKKISIKNRKRNKKIYRAEDGSIIVKKDPYRVNNGPIYRTKVGSKYLIRVNSLKLNNEYFTTKKAYLERCTSKNCDILEQLTPINNKGCFKINVYKSNTNQNKRGWVCQKYLR